MAIFCVEAGVVDEVDTAANHIPSGERGAVGLPCPRGTEGVPIISMVPIRMFIPSCKRQKNRTAVKPLQQNHMELLQLSGHHFLLEFENLIHTPNI